MKKKSICFVNGANPDFLGGISIYQKNLIKNLDKNKFEITWIYKGDKNKIYRNKKINYVELKVPKTLFLEETSFNKKVRKFLDKNYFDIINSHAIWGNWMKSYSKKKDQKIIHTYHGTTYPYYKIQLKKYNLFLKILFSPLLIFAYSIEKYPMKKADRIICVSEKIKQEVESLYGKRKNIFVIRTGVDLKEFKKLSKQKSRKDLRLDSKKIYGLYSGRGGHWNKGLDRAIYLGGELYSQNKNFSLIVIGADKNKCEKYLNFSFVEYRGLISRKELPKYHSASDFFLSLSRYEGGAPTLALSEAISSECLTICSKDSNPEILENKKDCLILEKYEKKEAKEILNLLKNKRKVNSIKRLAKEKIKKLSLDKWAKNYLKILLR